MYNANHVNTTKALLDSIEASMKDKQNKLQVTMTFGQCSAGPSLQYKPQMIPTYCMYMSVHTLNSFWYPVSPSTTSGVSSSFMWQARLLTGISVPPVVMPSRMASWRKTY